MSATAALYAIYDGILANIDATQDLTDETITALLRLFDETLIQALYLVDRGAVRIIFPLTRDAISIYSSIVEVQSRHPEPTRAVVISPRGTSVRQDWCECAEFTLVAGGARGSSMGPHALPFPVLLPMDDRSTSSGLTQQMCHPTCRLAWKQTVKRSDTGKLEFYQ
ncbi:unnamed protein product [Tilletia caries]|nr:unnamed protein product [Tilletia caries]CAD6970679.1 unnamed protein product [Tilletia controversa]